jgi:hypothetical protein
MTGISDETLMAYGDGELNPEQAEAVRTALERQPALRTRLERLQSIDEQLRAAFAPEVDLPDRFADLLRGAPTASVVRFADRRKFWAGWLPAGAAMAASVAGLIAGSVLTSGTAVWLRRVDDGIGLTSAVETVVTHTPSGKVALADGFNVAPILSFVSADGRMCREVHLNDTKMAARIVACKDAGADEWCIEAFARMPLPGPPTSYHAAGAAKDPVIDAAYVRLGAKSTLDPEAESAAIARGWSEK